MAKTYELASDDIRNFLKTALSLKENQEINGYNIRYGILMITETKDGGIIKALEPLPYRVKICSNQDVLLKKVDVEITIDRYYWDQLREDIEKVALMHCALNQLEIKVDKDGMAKFDDSGRVQLKKVKPDIVIEMYSNMCEMYEGDCPDIKMFRDFKTEFPDIVNKIA
jgi:hypothetical protein